MSVQERFGPEMSLGEHLEELRWRLFRVVVVLAVVFIAGFAFQNYLKLVFIYPLQMALSMADPAILAQLHLPQDASEVRLLRADQLTESPFTAMSVAFHLSIAVIIPYILIEMWGFVAPGLREKERRLGLLVVPGAASFFYLGAGLGYFFALPYLYLWMINWTAADPTAVLELRQTEYLSLFVTMTIANGLVMDVPWAVMVLIRLGWVTPQQLSNLRRHIYLGGIILAAVMTPPDVASQLAMFIPMVLLFELGLLAGRWLGPITERPT